MVNLSFRNIVAATILAIEADDISALITMNLAGGLEVQASILAEQVDELQLEPGKAVSLYMNEHHFLVGTGSAGGANSFMGRVELLSKGANDFLIGIAIEDNTLLYAVVPAAEVQALDIQENTEVTFVCKPSDVCIMTDEAISQQNLIAGSIVEVREGAIQALVVVQSEQGAELLAGVTIDVVAEMALSPGMDVFVYAPPSRIYLSDEAGTGVNALPGVVSEICAGQVLSCFAAECGTDTVKVLLANAARERDRVEESSQINLLCNAWDLAVVSRPEGEGA